MQVWGMLYYIGVQIAMNYLENNLSGVIIITSLCHYVTIKVYMYYCYHFNVIIYM